MPTSLEDIPDEIIRHILLYLPPGDALESFQLLSRRLHVLANEPLLWRWHCRNSFRYWHPDHKFREKLCARASSVDWKGLWITRKRNNKRIARWLDGVISTKVGQLRRLKQICELGYDAKDYLLEQCQVDDSAEDVLARRYESRFSLFVIRFLPDIPSRPAWTRSLDRNSDFRRCVAYPSLIGRCPVTEICCQVLCKLGSGQHSQRRGSRGVVAVPGPGIELSRPRHRSWRLRYVRVARPRAGPGLCMFRL